jgi:hypothetical protein
MVNGDENDDDPDEVDEQHSKNTMPKQVVHYNV